MRFPREHEARVCQQHDQSSAAKFEPASAIEQTAAIKFTRECQAHSDHRVD